MITLNFHCDLCGAKIISSCGTTAIFDMVNKEIKHCYPTLSNPVSAVNETVKHFCDNCLGIITDTEEQKCIDK